MRISRLKRRLSGDHNFKGHTILGSMCSEPHPVAKKTYKRFLSTNVGDPGLFPNLIQLEKEFISQLGTLLSNPSAVGQVVSGGSEANIMAMWSARNMAPDGARDVIISESHHFSFDKAANLLGLNLIKIPVGSDFRIDSSLIEQHISSNTMAIVGIAGSTGLGLCDDIVTLSDLAIKYDIFLHVDAAFGGFVFPFLEGSRPFDFSLSGVSSITMDPHKMGRAVIQSGCIIFRNNRIAESAETHVSYLSGGRAKNRSVLGTRSGASIAAAWMIYNYLGFGGYKTIVDDAMTLTKWLVDEIKKIDGLDVKVEPESNIVGLCTTGNMDIKDLLQEIRDRGWAVSEWSDYIRITLMPHVTKRTLKKFLNSLRSIMGRYSLHS